MVRDYIMMDICEEIRRNETWWIEFDLYWLHHSSWRKNDCCALSLWKKESSTLITTALWCICFEISVLLVLLRTLKRWFSLRDHHCFCFFFLIITHQNPLWPFLKEIPLCGLRSQPHKTWSRTREDEFWPSMLNNFDGPRAPL